MIARLFRMSRYIGLLFFFLLPALGAQAQPFPSQPIVIVVGFPPGSSLDIIARLLQPKMGEILGQQVVVENRPGAGGNIAAATVARSAPDGYHIVLAPSAITITPHVFKDPGFDLLKDLAPITLLAQGPLAIAVRSDRGINTLAELVDYGRKNPGKLNFGTPGAGSPQHLLGEMLAKETKVPMTHVPYRGSGPALNDLVGGNINFVISTLATMTPFVQSGRIKIIAISDAERFKLAPDIPTAAETYPGLVSTTWFAFMARAGTPATVINRLNDAAIAALKTDEVQKGLATASLTAVGEGPQVLDDLVKKEYELFGKVVKDSGISAS